MRRQGKHYTVQTIPSKKGGKGKERQMFSRQTTYKLLETFCCRTKKILRAEKGRDVDKRLWVPHFPSSSKTPLSFTFVFSLSLFRFLSSLQFSLLSSLLLQKFHHRLRDLLHLIPWDMRWDLRSLDIRGQCMILLLLKLVTRVVCVSQSLSISLRNRDHLLIICLITEKEMTIFFFLFVLHLFLSFGWSLFSYNRRALERKVREVMSWISICFEEEEEEDEMHHHLTVQLRVFLFFEWETEAEGVRMKQMLHVCCIAWWCRSSLLQHNELCTEIQMNMTM